MKPLASLAAGFVFAALVLWAILTPAPGSPGPGDATVKPDAPVEFRVDHVGDPMEADARCPDPSHWRIWSGGRDVTAPAELRKLLEKFSGRRRASRWDDPPASKSERRVEVRGRGGAPWGFLEKLHDEFDRFRIYKIDWILLGPDPEPIRLQAWFPRIPKSPYSPEPLHWQNQLFLKWDPSVGTTVCRLGNRDYHPTHDDLMREVVPVVAEDRKRGMTEPITLFPNSEVPWRDVARLAIRCRAEKLGDIQFALPIPSDDELPPTVQFPEKR